VSMVGGPIMHTMPPIASKIEGIRTPNKVVYLEKLKRPIN
jgi:hypothetical protein